MARAPQPARWDGGSPSHQEEYHARERAAAFYRMPTRHSKLPPLPPNEPSELVRSHHRAAKLLNGIHAGLVLALILGMLMAGGLLTSGGMVGNFPRSFLLVFVIVGVETAIQWVLRWRGRQAALAGRLAGRPEITTQTGASHSLSDSPHDSVADTIIGDARPW